MPHTVENYRQAKVELKRHEEEMAAAELAAVSALIQEMSANIDYCGGPLQQPVNIIPAD